MKLMLRFCLAVLFSLPAQASSKRYVLVGVSGFGTCKSSFARGSIFSDEVGNGCSGSGAWDHMHIQDPAVAYRTFLTLASDEKEVEQVLALFEDRDTHQCNRDLGIAIMAHSWGSGWASKIAAMYEKKCGTLPDFFVLLDGIKLHTMRPFTEEVRARHCLNFYQTLGAVQGRPLPHCENRDLSKTEHDVDHGSPHVWVSEKGGAYGEQAIKKMMRE